MKMRFPGMLSQQVRATSVMTEVIKPVSSVYREMESNRWSVLVEKPVLERRRKRRRVEVMRKSTAADSTRPVVKMKLKEWMKVEKCRSFIISEVVIIAEHKRANAMTMMSEVRRIFREERKNTR